MTGNEGGGDASGCAPRTSLPMIESFGREGDSLLSSLCSFLTVRTVESRGPDRCGCLCPVLLSFPTWCIASPRALHVDSLLLLDAANVCVCFPATRSDTPTGFLRQHSSLAPLSRSCPSLQWRCRPHSPWGDEHDDCDELWRGCPCAPSSLLPSPDGLWALEWCHLLLLYIMLCSSGGSFFFVVVFLPMPRSLTFGLFDSVGHCPVRRVHQL